MLQLICMIPSVFFGDDDNDNGSDDDYAVDCHLVNDVVDEEI